MFPNENIPDNEGPLVERCSLTKSNQHDKDSFYLQIGEIFLTVIHNQGECSVGFESIFQCDLVKISNWLI